MRFYMNDRMQQMDSDVLQTNPDSPKPSVGGIHVSRGVTMRIPPGGLVIAIDEPGMTITRVELQLDT
jgi:hypothetical protein